MNEPGRATSKVMQGQESSAQEASSAPPRRKTRAVQESGKDPMQERKQARVRAGDDKALVARAKGGDAGAFRELFDRYHRRAYSVALGMVRNPADAHDVLQEAFVKAHRNLAKFQGNSSFYTWFYRIVSNLCIDHIRKKKRVRTEDYETLAERRELSPPGGSRKLDASPRGSVLRGELRHHIQEALAAIPEHHRVVIVLREVEEFSYEEIAQTLDIPKGTVMSRLFHARKKMQEHLEDYMEKNTSSIAFGE